MRTIKGYVIVCETADDRLLLFGETLNAGGACQNFETNQLTPFSTLNEARFVAAHFLDGRKDLAGAAVNVGRIRLEIAENPSDLQTLRETHEKSFIAIFGYGDDNVQLIGKHAKGMDQAFDTGGFLTDKADPFAAFAEALYLAEEATRQGQRPATVAFCSLRVFARTHRQRRPIRRKR
jgi:hypothetical protein